MNYPWFDYGWDFGLGPAAWRGGRTTPRWADAVDGHLRHFQRLGISVVRWFVLADGLTYGIDADAPAPDPAAPGGWRFDPPPLSHECLEHFDELLGRFAVACADGRPSIQLLPVLIDFHFCGPGARPVQTHEPAGPSGAVEDPRWVKQGRAEAVIDAVKRQQFLDRVLEPLLRVSGRHGDVIYAWELINEPDWVTGGWHSHPFARPPVQEAAMRAFIEDGARRVRQAGFKATVGFASARSLRKSGIAMDIDQFHHYPGGARWLNCGEVAPGRPCIIGEFATTPADVWPDMPLQSQRVLDRLRLARDLTCPLAIPWSFLARDRHTDWSPEVERDIETFTGEEPSVER
ncbi:MAG: hypothetical protein ABL971_11565 [Vicinamibacterales bacterium]